MTDTPKPFTFLTPSKINATSFDGGVFMIHGNYASGKTHLAGDACLHYHKQGKKFVFFNIKGEDGQTSAMRPEFADLDYQAFMDIPKYGAIKEAVAYSQSLGAHIAVVDSLSRLYKVIEDHTTGGTKPTDGWDEWKNVHYEWYDCLTLLRTMAPIVLFLCPSSLGGDAIATKEKGINEKDAAKASNKFIAPDLPGQLASTSLGACDIVGYMKTNYLESKSEMQRRVCFTNPNTYKVRQKLPKEITYDILIPPNEGGWAKILGEIQKAYGH